MIRPLLDRVLIKPLPQESNPTGIVIPEFAMDKPDSAIVIAVGPGKRDENGKLKVPMIKIGATILYRKIAGQEFKDGIETYLLIGEDDILCAVTE